MKRIHKFLQLSQREKVLLIYAFLVLATVTMGLWVFPWLTLQRLLLKPANWYSRFVNTRRPAALQIAWVVKVASSFIPKATCLPRALATQILLIQNTYPAELKIGIARGKDGKLGAHAWVTSEGNILIGSVPDLDHFVLLSAMESHSIEDYGRAD